MDGGQGGSLVPPHTRGSVSLSKGEAAVVYRCTTSRHQGASGQANRSERVARPISGNEWPGLSQPYRQNGEHTRRLSGGQRRQADPVRPIPHTSVAGLRCAVSAGERPTRPAVFHAVGRHGAPPRRRVAVPTSASAAESKSASESASGSVSTSNSAAVAAAIATHCPLDTAAGATASTAATSAATSPPPPPQPPPPPPPPLPPSPPRSPSPAASRQAGGGGGPASRHHDANDAT